LHATRVRRSILRLVDHLRLSRIRRTAMFLCSFLVQLRFVSIGTMAFWHIRVLAWCRWCEIHGTWLFSGWFTIRVFGVCCRCCLAVSAEQARALCDQDHI